MALKTGDLANVIIDDLPVWEIPPTIENLFENSLLGTLDKGEIFVVIQRKRNGTVKCLSRFGVCWLVAACAKKINR